MKNLIIEALNEYYNILMEKAPETKKKRIVINIDDKNVSPINLHAFMKKNSIPERAEFWVDCDRGFSKDICLSYDIDIPTTEEDKEEYIKKRFITSSFTAVYHKLIKNGYTRHGCNSGLFKSFDDTSVYNMYMKEEHDRLVKYYSLTFTKKD